MKEYLWCAPEIIRGPYQQRGSLHFILRKQREVQDNMVHVIMQPTADHKRYDDSHKWMTSVLGDKVRKMSSMFQHNSNFFLSSQPSTIQALYYHLLFFLSVCDIVFTIFMEVSVSDSSQSIEEYWTRNEFPSRVPRRWTDYIKGNYMQMHGWTIVYRNTLALWSFSILSYIVLYSLLWKLYF